MKKQTIILTLIIVPIVFAFAGVENNKFEEERHVNAPAVGDFAPEITMTTTDGKTTYRLSELRGKLVLVNFWASMVAQCRFENPNIVNAYKRFKDQKFKNGNGFEVFSVSLDTDMDKWQNAINRDRLIWKYHVSDLKGYKSSAAHDYGVKAMPYNFLIDGEGQVIAVNLKGSELNKTIESFIKK